VAIMSILQMSIPAGILVIAIIIIRAVALNKLPKKMFLVLWGVAICRLLIPVSIPSRFSFYSIMNGIINHISPSTPVSDIGNILPSNGIMAGTTGQITPTTPEQVFSIAPTTIIWIVGMLSAFIFFAVVYLKNYRELRFALPIRDNVFLNEWLTGHSALRPITIMQSDRITTPVAVGMVKPRIILPKSMNMEDKPLLQYVLTHEYYHIRRFDTLWKLLLVGAFCIHWFNPMVWVMFVLVNRDLELTCDEMVIRHFGTDTKTAYAYSLIGMAEQRNKFAPLYNGFSKNAAEERITAIMKFKKTSALTIILAVILVVGTTTAFALSAAASTENPPADTTNAPDGNVQTLSDGGIMMSHVDTETGETLYSWDDGQTWTPLTDEEYEALTPDVEWWTYEEYKAWMEQEIKDLQALADDGEPDYYDKDGVLREFTQADVDEASALYQSILDEIKSGKMVSKTVDGSTDIIMISYDSEDIATSRSYEAGVQLDNGETAHFGPYDTKEELLAEMKPYCEEQVKAGNMTQKEADELLSKYQ